LKPKDKQKGLNIVVPENLEPVFSNSVLINHKDDEFALTFVQMMPISNKGKARAVVSLTPQHAKRLVRALEENIKKYEESFGEIKLTEEKKTDIKEPGIYR